MLTFALAFSAALAPARGEDAAPRRVVSANLCADQLLLTLADRDQIASLSYLAADETLSPVARDAKAFALNRGTGEDIARLDADLVLIGAYDTPFTRALLKERGLPTYALAPWRSLAEGRAQIAALAARLGHPERGAALIARIDAALAEARGAAARPATFLTLHRRAYAPGGRTVVAEIATAAGLRDLSREMGVETGGFVPIEKVIAARPDYLIVSDVDARAIDNGTALMWHPALAALYPPDKRLVSPDPLTLCAGPATPAAIDGLAAEIRGKVR
ncbi:MAG: ABC transporter substrate-binding protein [Rhizobiales bacterium]|nr:ABC transporter substrate-binding protein [Hyphomicrobiales bacterium]